jgi:uncharacterized protein
MKLRYMGASVLVVATLLAGTVASSLPKNSASASPSKDTQETNVITVSGTGTISAKPDIAYINLGVDAVDPDVQVAVADANSRTEALIAALTEAGIAEADIRTDVYNIYQEYNQPDPSIEATRNFHVSIFMTVTVRDVSQVGELLSTTIGAGANAVNGIQFSIADRAALEAEARKLALADARSKADQLAGEIEVSIVGPLHIEEYNNVSVAQYDVIGKGGGGAPISDGSLNVTLSLNVTYSFE